MNTLLFSRNTGKWTGIDRQKQPFETEIRNVQSSKLTKTKTRKSKRIKKNELGQTLYILPVEDTIEEIEKYVMEETLEVTDTPALHIVKKRTPIMDNGNQRMKRDTRTVVTTEVTDVPVHKRLSDGTRVHKTNEKGEELYYKLSPYGEEYPVFEITLEEAQKMKGDEPVYLREKLVVEEIRHPNEPLEVTEDNPQYEEGLNPATETFTEEETIRFEYSPEEFLFKDVVDFKRLALLDGTFGTQSWLYETMEHLFVTGESVNATVGYDYVELGTSGSIMTPTLTVEPSKFVTFVPEISSGQVSGLEMSVVKPDGTEVNLNDNFEYQSSSDELESFKLIFRNHNTNDTIRISSLGIII